MTYLKTIWINLWILDLLITNSHWWLDNSKVVLIVKGLVQTVRILICRECSVKMHFLVLLTGNLKKLSV